MMRLSQSASNLPFAFEQHGVEPLAIDYSVLLNSSKQSEFGSFKHLSLGGSPVLARRRQRSNKCAVLPPLPRSGREDLVFDLLEQTSQQAPQLRKGRHSSLPPLGKAPSMRWGNAEPLIGTMEQGPPLRPLATLSSVLAPVEAKLSAMALDLMSDKETSCETSKSDDISEIDQELPGEELLLPVPEGPMEQHWFSFSTFEAQVRNWRQEVPAPKTVAAAHLQDFSVDSDDDEFEQGSCSSTRVRPGEFLHFDPDDLMEDVDVDISEEDVGMFTAENALDDAMRGFLTEVLSDDEDDDDDNGWVEQEEV